MLEDLIAQCLAHLFPHCRVLGQGMFRLIRDTDVEFAEEAEDLDGGPGYPIITGDYSGAPAWAHREVGVGQKVVKPSPIFVKLDPSIIEEELGRLGIES